MSQLGQPRRPHWIAASLPFLLVGGLAAWLSLQSLETWQVLGGKLVADGNLDILDLIPARTIRLGLITAAVLSLGLAVIMILKPDWLQRLLISLQGALKRIPGDLRTSIHDLHGWPHDRRDTWILLAILAVSLLVRVPLLDRPMAHDEAYTAVTWAPGPLSLILRDYHLPNNHIFHTVLVSISYDLFGSQPWSIRLPAFTAAMLLIPAGYGLTRRWYGRVPALAAAVLIGMAPVISNYATNARGYSWFMLFGLLVFWLAARLVRQNNTVEWLLLAVFAALGFWTVPMMLYPFGAVCVWIGLAAFFDPLAVQAYGSRLRLIKYLAAVGILTVFLTALMYSPVIRYSGTADLFNNPFVTPLSLSAFFPTLFESRLPEVLRQWLWGFYNAGTALVMAGITLSLILHRKISRYPIHIMWAVLLWVIPVLLLRRPNAWPRTWSFLFPMGFIWGIAGWTGFAGLIKVKRTRREFWHWFTRAAAGGLLIAVLVVGFQYSRQICTLTSCTTGDEEDAVIFLQPHLQENDLVLVESPSSAPLWYYFGQYDVSMEHVNRERLFDRAFLVVRPPDGQTVDGIISAAGFDESMFDMTTLSQVHASTNLIIYQIEGKK